MSLQSCAAFLESRCKDKQLYKINKISKKNNFYYTIYQHYIFTKKTLTLLVFGVKNGLEAHFSTHLAEHKCNNDQLQNQDDGYLETELVMECLVVEGRHGRP